MSGGTITTYIVVDSKGQYVGEEHSSMREAINGAQQLIESGEPAAVVEFTYEFYDSELVWTPNGETEWA